LLFLSLSIALLMGSPARADGLKPLRALVDKGIAKQDPSYLYVRCAALMEGLVLARPDVPDAVFNTSRILSFEMSVRASELRGKMKKADTLTYSKSVLLDKTALSAQYADHIKEIGAKKQSLAKDFFMDDMAICKEKMDEMDKLAGRSK
jgi:hypothetical protein